MLPSKTHLLEFSGKMLITIMNIPWEKVLYFFLGEEGILISDQGNICVNFLSQLYSTVLFFYNNFKVKLIF